MRKEDRLYIKIPVLLLCYVVGAAVQTLSLKADIGVCAVWDSVSLNLSRITGIKIGYISIVGNLILVLLQLAVLKKEFKPSRFLQVPMVVLFGEAINFFYYDVFKFEPGSYLIRLLLCIISYAGLAVIFGIVTYMDIMSTPGEALCFILEQKKGIPFARSRVILDLCFMAFSVTLSLIFKTPFTVREGTVIGMLILGPMMHECMKFYKKVGLFE